MGYFQLIEKRYSARAYKPDDVEKEKLDKILEAARLAPTACNLQAFKILVIKTAGREKELNRIYRANWFSEAPYILGICSIPGKSWVRRDGKNYSDVDSAIVMDHIILAGAELGLGTCWIGAFDATAAREVLGLGDEVEPVAFTPLGYARETAVTKVRKPLEDLVVYK